MKSGSHVIFRSTFEHSLLARREPDLSPLGKVGLNFDKAFFIGSSGLLPDLEESLSTIPSLLVLENVLAFRAEPVGRDPRTIHIDCPSGRHDEVNAKSSVDSPTKNLLDSFAD